MRIALLPADERPVHLRYPAMLAAIAGVELVVPPRELLPRFRESADTAGLATWLRDIGGDVDVVIVSLELLCHGGMVPSRLTTTPTDMVVSRLSVLRELRERPRPPLVDASGFVTRLPALDDATEEPDYWAEHGRDLGILSRVADLASRGEATEEQLASALAVVPEAHVADTMRRRLRNHALLLAALTSVAEGTLDGLVLSADDTSPDGLPAREGRWLDIWLETLDLADRVHRYAGADEVASVRTVRWLTDPGDQPTVALLDHGGLDRVAAYEAQPIRETARGQIRSVGARCIVDHRDAEVVLAITSPEIDGDWALAPPAHDREREARQMAFADDVADLVDAGHWVAVADCSEPNGGSVAFVRRLAERGVLERLGAYAGWNTAGNSIGSALAQAIVGRSRGGPGTEHERLLVHRLVEDVGYQTVVRTALRADRAAAGQTPEPLHAERPAFEALLAELLQDQLARLGTFAERWKVDPEAVRLVWQHTFACDLAVVPVDRGIVANSTRSTTGSADA